MRPYIQCRFGGAKDVVWSRDKHILSDDYMSSRMITTLQPMVICNLHILRP